MQALEEKLLALVQSAKSSAEMFWPTWADEWMIDLQVGATWLYSFPVFQHGYNNLRIQMKVVSMKHIEITIDLPDGSRLGIMHMRGEP